MAVTDARGLGSEPHRIKAAGPTAAAIGIITTLVGVSLIAGAPNKPTAPADTPSAPVATDPSVPAPAPGVPGIQSTQQGAAPTAVGIEIVVKFKDDGKVKDIIDAFWKDQASAKAKFETWKASHPEFANLKLDRVTYSNELVLVHDGSAPAAQQLSAMKSIVTKLGGLADISYAEPNMTAHPGGQ